MENNRLIPQISVNLLSHTIQKGTLTVLGLLSRGIQTSDRRIIDLETLGTILTHIRIQKHTYIPFRVVVPPSATRIYTPSFIHSSRSFQFYISELSFIGLST